MASSGPHGFNPHSFMKSLARLNLNPISSWIPSSQSALSHGPRRLQLAWANSRRPDTHVSITERQKALETAETRMLRAIKTPLRKHFVAIPKSRVYGNESIPGAYYINTISTTGDPQEQAHKPHLLLVHGWGGGLGIWINNIDELSKHYNVHAIDLLGWGRSSRPRISGCSPTTIQDWWVESIEAWRIAQGIDRFTLAGHSMGGFISASYAARYGPQHLDKLTLLSPIGIKGFAVPPSQNTREVVRNVIVKSVWRLTPQRILSYLSPSRVRDMLLKSRSRVAAQFPYQDDTAIEYVYRLATVGNISGETAFTRLMDPTLGWTLPIGEGTIKQFNFPVVFAYGSRDWIDPTWAATRFGIDKVMGDQAHVYVLPDSGHHGYCEASKAFVDILLNGEQPEGCRIAPIRTREQLISEAGDRSKNTLSIA
ncbi:Alpha/Beta hydrolase protein [Polychytrium aggregatum]|uniref:Alpha/Beta hydrolase protein n=1 Tax=Polychytrium aggregatum TaxID=110093 RepID=UPI0022FEF37A|nr:Alpha/Beta hydrolase protein [Polychytrium aggregatum]KAI9205793.1 Alpha/Beta hydrolase protein [Polychytrium aggregatum]